MMNVVDKFVFQSIIDFPTIYPSRRSVLRQTLLVVGNGCEWESDGTMGKGINPRRFDSIEESVIAQEFSRDKEIEERRKWMGQINYGTGEMADVERAIDEEMVAKINQRHDEYIETIKNATALSTSVSEVILPEEVTERSHYYEKRFAEPYAMICNIPDNVHPDWLDACIEVANAVKLINPDADELLRKLKGMQE